MTWLRLLLTRRLGLRPAPTYRPLALASRKTPDGLIVVAHQCDRCGVLVGNRNTHTKECRA